MRLIDADDLRKELKDYVFPITENNLMGAADAYYRTVHLIDNAPTIDAQPVVHGKWIYKYMRHSECSNCGELRNVYTQICWNYCPNCGAKMDGGADET